MRDRFSWLRFGLTAAAAAAYAFFWLHGPLQAPSPVFEFEPSMRGFDEPGTVGADFQPPAHGRVGDVEEHPFWHIMAARERPQPLHGIIGDTRANPGLKEEVARLVFSHAKKFGTHPEGVKIKAAPDLYYAEERDAGGQLARIYFENTGINKDVKGYAGPIDIGLAVGPDGRILAVRHLRSLETTSYLKKIEKVGFYEQFRGMPLDDESHRVDLVSGASLTTEGIARSVSQLVAHARDAPLGVYLDKQPTGFDVRAVMPSTWMVDAGLITALFVVAAFGFTRRSSRLNLAFMVVTVAYLGFWLNNSFTYVTYTQPFLGSGWSWILGIYATLALGGAIWGGNTYCRYVCPYGNLQRLLLRIQPYRGRLPVSNRVILWLRGGLALGLVAGIGAGLRDWGSFELFPDLFGLEFMASPWFWGSLAVVLLSTYYPMLWCRLLCPTGAVLDGIAELSRSRRSATTQEPRLAGIPIRAESPAAR